MKCFRLLLDIKVLAKNIGLYIFLPTFIMYFVCIIILYRKEYYLLKLNIDEIINAKITVNFVVGKSEEEIFLSTFKNKNIILVANIIY